MIPVDRDYSWQNEPPAPRILDITATLLCDCGEQMEIDAIDDGWQHIYPCDCGRYLSVQIGDPIAQYDRGRSGVA